MPPAPSPARRARIRPGSAVVLAAIWITTLVWGCLYQSTVLPNAGTSIGRSGIADERRFYVTNMGIQNPVTAEDFTSTTRACGRWSSGSRSTPRGQGGVILAVGQLRRVVRRTAARIHPAEQAQGDGVLPQPGYDEHERTARCARVADQMGLAYPLAAHTERLVDGRIGHDKNLRAEWVVAEAKAVSHKPELPSYLDEDAVAAAVALTCPETKKRYRSYEGTWSWDRFADNLKNAVTFNSYRIQREPEYEILRCGLTPPSTHR